MERVGFGPGLVQKHRDASTFAGLGFMKKGIGASGILQFQIQKRV